MAAFVRSGQFALGEGRLEHEVGSKPLQVRTKTRHMNTTRRRIQNSSCRGQVRCLRVPETPICERHTGRCKSSLLRVHLTILLRPDRKTKTLYREAPEAKIRGWGLQNPHPIGSLILRRAKASDTVGDETARARIPVTARVCAGTTGSRAHTCIPEVAILSQMFIQAHPENTVQPPDTFNGNHVREPPHRHRLKNQKER